MSQKNLLKNYRPNVGVVLFNRDGRVFFGRRVEDFSDLSEFADRPNDWRWQFPQGGVDKGEAYDTAAFRELKEETGVSKATLIMMTPGWLAYDLPTAIGKEAWKGRWRGQAQKWFAFRLTGPDSEIDIATPAGGHKAEFDAWRWERLERTVDLIIPFKQGVYREVASLFAPFAAT